VRFMLKLRKSYSVVNAVENAVRMDDELWSPLTSQVDGLDVIHAGHGNPGARLDSAKIRLLINFLRWRYGVLCFDLSGNLEQYSIDIMLESKHIFLVTTPELPALHLARQKLDFLASYDLAGRVSLLLNREHKRAAVPRHEVEDILGLGIHAAFPNDYAGVHLAAEEGRPVDPLSGLGRQAAILAAWMAGAELETSPTQPPPRRFIEFFFIPGPADRAAVRRHRVAG
ncbi:MAG: AAA family ATPase, partial [Bryobacteraceae bacterium]